MIVAPDAVDQVINGALFRLFRLLLRPEATARQTRTLTQSCKGRLACALMLPLRDTKVAKSGVARDRVGRTYHALRLGPAAERQLPRASCDGGGGRGGRREPELLATGV